jgi:hypothetical protein
MIVSSWTRVAALDSSPLLLWLAGRTDSLIIARFKHLAMYQLDDCELLDQLVGGFGSLITTPHILTEVSNHARHLKGPLGALMMESFAKFSAECAEHFVAASELSKQSEYRRFGITDCGLASLGSEVTVVTTDFDLAGVLQAQGQPVINFNNFRQARFFDR